MYFSLQSSAGIENYSVEVKSGPTQLASFYDSADKVYRQKVEVKDVGVDVRHDFEGTTTAPSDVNVNYKDFKVGVTADSKDAAYRLSIGDKNNRLEASRDFDDRINHLKGRHKPDEPIQPKSGFNYLDDLATAMMATAFQG